MKTNSFLLKSSVLGMLLVSNAITANASSSDEWQFGATLYGWLPDVSGSLLYEVPPDSGGDVGVDIGDILDNLSMTFMGTFEARRGKLSLFTDIIYLGLSNDKTASIDLGPVSLKADVDIDSDYWVVTAGAGYTVVDSQQMYMDAIGGVRYLSAAIDTSVKIVNKRTFSISEDVWDGIVGVRGSYSFNDQWYMPFYGDIGTGESDLTWQAVAGIGYRFGWGDMKLVYRHLEYEQSSNKFIQDLAFSGPAMGVSFRF